MIIDDDDDDDDVVVNYGIITPDYYCNVGADVDVDYNEDGYDDDDLNSIITLCHLMVLYMP